MARLQDLRSTWEEYKGWFFLLFILYLFYSFRKFFAAIGDAAGASAEAATADLRKAAQAKSDKARVNAAAPKVSAKKITDAQLATWRADAATLADYFGTARFSLSTIVPDQMSAFAMLKQRYSRLTLYNNKPFHTVNGHAVSQTSETADSQKNPVYWTVLSPFYKDVTGGHDLRADMQKTFKDIRITSYLKWVI